MISHLLMEYRGIGVGRGIVVAPIVFSSILAHKVLPRLRMDKINLQTMCESRHATVITMRAQPSQHDFDLQFGHGKGGPGRAQRNKLTRRLSVSATRSQASDTKGAS